MLIVLAFSLISLTLFLVGIILALLEIPLVWPAVLVVIMGIVGMFISAAFWLRRPHWNMSEIFRRFRRKKMPLANMPMRTNFRPAYHKKPHCTTNGACSATVQLNHDSTENLMRSIRGIPYLIQAIQYSLETTILSEMGQSGTSVIHTAPGCSSVLDCDSDDETLAVATSISPRLSGPEELWQTSDPTHWTNQQLKLCMNRASSSLAVFPLCEARHMPDSFDDADPEGGDDSQLHGSMQSSLSRVTVARTSVNSREIRVVSSQGMSSAFLSRFNNSFRM